MGRGTARVAVVEGPRPCPSVSASRCHLPIAPRQGGLRTDPKFEGGRSGGTATLFISALDHRSEEHTSELQSLMRISYAVFCLKKKNTNQQTINKDYINS